MLGLELELPVEEWQTEEKEAKYSVSSAAAALGTIDTELNDSFQVPSEENEPRPLSPIGPSRRMSSSSASSEHQGASMHVLRIPVPAELQSVTFYQVVLHLFKSTRLIAFAIFREQIPGRRNSLPVTLTCPDPSTRIKSSDQIFVFTR
jgi:hypothetical protein